jgi:hypothetical protein
MLSEAHRKKLTKNDALAGNSLDGPSPSAVLQAA